MKKWLYTTNLNLALAISTIEETFDKIVVVNIFSIFHKFLQRIAIAKKLKNACSIQTTELKSIERDLNKKTQCFQRDCFTIKTSKQNLLEKLVIVQRETFSIKAQEFEQDSHYSQIKTHNKILSHIRDVVKNITIKEGYDITINSNAIAYFKNTKDITDNVLRQVK
ncbi:Chaperone protein Skp precursor [Candidatus Gullanella endobia]|uniref:Chaperone protein Skp n=1 Tax=Candidatus Gullanella endobia TaxID=1070130 RepID=A0A143WQA5_9ENTR|nr:OmpH family outer membrane protein [Candidatus Gullanella endobia]CUX95801.1 Chaperone protein Skp precursor [Candidatus Gullanella endobia]